MNKLNEKRNRPSTLLDKLVNMFIVHRILDLNILNQLKYFKY